ncbi:MAG: hypothetical protein ACHP6H_02835, partial [Legionellales bacterium]
LEVLSTQRPIHLHNIKISCTEELKNYLGSRGSFDAKNRFFPSLITLIFRNTGLTRDKALRTKQLIQDIHKADSIKTIGLLLKEARRQNDKSKTLFTTSGLERSLGKCLLMVEVGKKISPLQITQHPRQLQARL